MAAPPTTTLNNLAGRYTLNKSLSDDYISVLQLQGVNSLIRKAVSVASIHMKVTQPTRNKFRMAQTATAVGFPGTTEEYVLDWEWRVSTDAFFGGIRHRSRWVDPVEALQVESEVLGDEVVDWDLGEGQDALIQSEGESVEDGWRAVHLWAFEVVGGLRRYVRRTRIVSKDGKEKRVRMVYDYVDS